MPVDFGFIEIKWYAYFYAINVCQQRERERERSLTNKCKAEKIHVHYPIQRIM